MNSREWRDIRAKKMAANPLCERCSAMGYVTASQCVHHLVEVESGHTKAECEELCYRWNNLQALCYQCHAEIHKAKGKGTKENHQQRENERLQRWIERHGGQPSPPRRPPGLD